jgi:hypothetical protein
MNYRRAFAAEAVTVALVSSAHHIWFLFALALISLVLVALDVAADRMTARPKASDNAT